MRSLRSALLLAALAIVSLRPLAGQGPVAPAGSSTAPAPAPPAAAGFDLARLARMDAVINDAIADHKLPGAVVLVGRGDTIVWRKAYGDRALVPAREPMTLDTIFDLASLTKVVATTTAVMMLVEDGKIRLTDPVAAFIPEFGRKGKERVTIRDLMTHMSGLRPDLDLADAWSGAATAIALASDETLTSPPGRRFTYSDINFILLGEIVARVSHTPLEVFTRDRIFAPLGMTDTMFLPPASLVPRIAPTEPCPVSKLPCGCAAPEAPPCGPGQTILRGVVHDPTSRRMGGVAGHAGLFSTAANLSIFCRMLLGGGAVGTTRILAPLTVGRMTSPATPAGDANVRGLGWDLDSSYSSNRGELLPLGSFGHTGFTGTSLWMDPATRVFIVFLSNRVHPDGKGDVTPLRARVATIVASSLTGITSEAIRQMSWSRPPAQADAPGTAGGAVTAGPSPGTPGLSAASAPMPPVLTGIDVLRADGFSLLKGQRVGLLTNLTGRARDGVTTIDLLAAAPGVTLTALFSPEHGIRGVLDESVPSTNDEKTGLPIYSLYGQTERPTAAMLDGLDAIVIDLQDIGARFYTYTTTMAYVMEESAAHKIKVIVLDRPNPIGGAMVEGPSLDAGATSFIGYFPAMPIRHGMTIGELARLFNGERHINADLTVVSMKNWRRDEWFDETGQSWINPSPNMRTLYAATLYPGIGAFESANISVGRGTDTPFEHVGAPWIDGVRLSDALNARRLPGLRFYPVRFTPTASRFANTECQGVFITITDRAAVRPVRLGVEIASALLALFPGQLQVDSAARLFGSQDGLARLKAGEDPAAIAASWTAAEALWRQLRAKYVLYLTVRHLQRVRVAVLAAVTVAAALALPAQSRAPKLIVLLVVDQMRGDYVDRFQREWTGGFHRLLTEGARFTRADYPYFNTVTCAGHATISTGTYPSVHGMIEDGWFDRATAANIECTDDAATTVVSYGAPVRGPGKSAARMRVPALADVLRSDLQPHARIVSFSLKARAAAIMAGKHADAIAWFYDSNAWTSSTAYSAAPVPAVDGFIKSHRPATDARFITRPEADRYLAEMAANVADQLGLGKTTSTDFMAIGFSVLDFVGHEFGPRSPQVEQVLASLDRTLGDLFAWLDRAVGAGNYTVALSADHGVGPVPEEAQQQGLDAGRTSTSDMVRAVNDALAPAFGPGQFVSSIAAGDIYINASVWAQVKGNAAVIARLKAGLGRVGGIGRVYVAADFAANRFEADAIGRSLALGYDKERSGDIEVAVKPYWIIASAGASHGSSNEYDTRVPLVLMGKGITAGEGATAPASPADIAPTLAFLAGVKLPKAQGRVLREAVK